ncbi:ABC transporter permease, partial [Clostridium perfringens]
MGAFLDHLRGDYPDVTGTRFWPMNAIVHQGSTVTDEQLSAVDPNFFALLTFPTANGDPAKALAGPDSAVITQQVARKYFGT